MDRRPEGHQPHPSEIRLFLCEAKQHSGTGSTFGRSQRHRISGGWVARRDQSPPASRLSDDLTGDAHKRHRRAMAPAFGLVEAKGLLPYFMDAAIKARELRVYLISGVNSDSCHQMADKWSGIIANSKSGYSAVLDVNMWFGKATIDACASVQLPPVLGICGL